MKKYLWALLCALSLNAQAQEAPHKLLSQWFDPVLQMGTQQSLDESEDKNPAYMSCLSAIFNKHVLPEVVPNAVQMVQQAGYADRVKALEQFLSQPTEQQAFAQTQVPLKRLIAGKQWTQAAEFWGQYLEQMIRRMPVNAQQGLQYVMSSLDIPKVLNSKNIDTLMRSEPACVNYLKAQKTPMKSQ